MLKSAYSSPKVKTLARKLGIPFPHALGLCGLLWNFAAEHAPHGDVGKFSDEELAEVMYWTGDTATLIGALTDVRLLDRCQCARLVIHDWLDHCPQYVKNKITQSRGGGRPGVHRGVDPGSTPLPTRGPRGGRPGVTLPLPSPSPLPSPPPSPSDQRSEKADEEEEEDQESEDRKAGGIGNIGQTPELDPVDSGFVTLVVRKLTGIVGPGDAVRLADIVRGWPRERRYERFKAVLAESAGKKAPKAWLKRVIENEGAGR